MPNKPSSKDDSLKGMELEFSKLLLAIAQKLTQPEREGGRAAFPHGIGSIDISASIELQKVSFSLKIADAVGPAMKQGADLQEPIADRLLNYCISLDKNDDPVMADCNAFVKAVAGHFGVTITGNADAIVDSFTNPPFTRTSTNPDDALTWANSGLVVAGMRKSELNPKYGTKYKNGHVAIAHNIADPKGFPMASWGVLGGRGASNSTIRLSFPATASDDGAIHFAFVPLS